MTPTKQETIKQGSQKAKPESKSAFKTNRAEGNMHNRAGMKTQASNSFFQLIVLFLLELDENRQTQAEQGVKPSHEGAYFGAY